LDALNIGRDSEDVAT
jgi:hypothetical protein